MPARGGHTTLCVFPGLGNAIAEISRCGIVKSKETKYRRAKKCDGLARANSF
jgi:hypothetical protein